MPSLIRLHSPDEHYATVDDDIFLYIGHLRWYLKKPVQSQQKSYAYRITSIYPAPQRVVTMHKEVVRFYGLLWIKIGHHNGNGLDNRLENLVPFFCVAELDRRAEAIREYQKIKAIRDYWVKHEDG